MIAVAMVPLLLTAAVAVAPDPAPPASQDQAVRVRLDKDGDYYPGHDAQVDVRTEYDGFLLVLHVDPQGRLRVLFPLEPFDDAFVEGGKQYDLVNRGGRGSFYVEASYGIGTVFAAHSDWPFHASAFAKDHRWDYETLWVSPEADVETALVDLVAKMSYDGWFEYDLVQYEVYSDRSYAGGGPSYHIYREPYVICCTTTVGASVFIGAVDYYPYGYPWYFGSYWYYPYYHYYRPYYAFRASYYYPSYRGRYAGWYPRTRDYRFKPPYRYDRGRSPDQYRPRVGVDAGRHAFGGGGIDYRPRRTAPVTPVVSPRRRSGTPVATASGTNTGRTRPAGRVGTRRTGSPPSGADRSRTDGRNPRRRTDIPKPWTGDRAWAEPGRPADAPTRRTGPAPSRATPADGRSPRRRVDTPRPRTGDRQWAQPSRRAGVPTRRPAANPSRAAPPSRSGKSLGRPVLKRSEPKTGRRPQLRPGNSRPGRSAGSGRSPRPKASRPPTKRSNGRASRPSAPRSRPKAGGGGGRRSGASKAPARPKARSGGSRRRP